MSVFILDYGHASQSMPSQRSTCSGCQVEALKHATLYWYLQHRPGKWPGELELQGRTAKAKLSHPSGCQLLGLLIGRCPANAFLLSALPISIKLSQSLTRSWLLGDHHHQFGNRGLPVPMPSRSAGTYWGCSAGTVEQSPPQCAMKVPR